MTIVPKYDELEKVLKRPADAQAMINGSSSYPNIQGLVLLYQSLGGVILVAQVQGLPQGTSECSPNIYGFHIHEGKSCTGNAQDPFADADGHYNPKKCPHPAHAGDLPPLFGNRGYAFMIVFTDRFSVKDVIGRTVIVHANPDDFTTQPAGNSGTKIACGLIQSN